MCGSGCGTRSAGPARPRVIRAAWVSARTRGAGRGRSPAGQVRLDLLDRRGDQSLC